MYARGICLACYNFSRPQFGHQAGACAACGRTVPLKTDATRTGYCRLCWCQAREDRAQVAGDARSAVVMTPHLPKVRFHQLFLADLARRRAAPRAHPRRFGHKGRPPKPPPAPAVQPTAGAEQLALFPLPPGRLWDLARVDLRRGPAPDNRWLACALHLAHTLAEARGWAPTTRRGMQRVLVTVLARHRDGELVPASAVHTVATRHSVNTDYAVEILAATGVLDDDRPDVFARWLNHQLADLAPAFRREAKCWALTLRDGGTRNRARSVSTVDIYVRCVRPALLDWSTRYDHPREVTRDDVRTHIGALHGDARQSAVSALRSLFAWAKRTGAVFRNPILGIKPGRRERAVWQPLSPADITDAVNAATTPQARVFVALAAVHAARSGQIRAMRLDDVDLAGRRLTIAGTDRPLDDLTYRILLAWLTHRSSRWPDTANPHLLVSRESALRHGPVSHAWIRNLRSLPVTVERLRIDRQLEEALQVGFDPLHLAEVFGIAETTAVRYAANARQLLERPHEEDTARTSPGTPVSGWQDEPDVPLSSS